MCAIIRPLHHKLVAAVEWVRAPELKNGVRNDADKFPRGIPASEPLGSLNSQVFNLFGGNRVHSFTGS